MLSKEVKKKISEIIMMAMFATAVFWIGIGIGIAVIYALAQYFL